MSFFCRERDVAVACTRHVKEVWSTGKRTSHGKSRCPGEENQKW